MAKALFLRKGAMDEIVDPYGLLRDHGWETVPGEHPGFMIWRKLGQPGRIFLYESGRWQLIDNTRHVLENGPDIESLEVYLTGNVKPLEHMG